MKAVQLSRIAVCVTGLGLLAACVEPGPAPQPDPAPPGFGGQGNPASAYCVSQGGVLENRSGPGGETGYCRLPNGLVVDEWSLFQNRK